MNHTEYFELSCEPFSNAPVSRFYFNSTQHAEALTRLRYAVDGMKGLAVLVGDIGAGKTTLARRMLDSLPEEEFEAALLVIIHGGITASWLLKRIALQMGVMHPQTEKLALLSQLYQRLVQIHEAGKKAVVLIDEAQMLATRELMEEFRGMLNLEVPENKLISFIFFGLPEIEDNLRLDPPLAQRVALRVRLEALDAESTEAYVKHRLRLAGAKRMLFTPEAIRIVHDVSRGTPRVINTLCDNALFEAFLLRRDTVDGDLQGRVASNLGLILSPQPRPPAVPVPAPLPPPAEAAPPPQPVRPAPTTAPRPPAPPAGGRTRRLDLDEIDSMLTSISKG
jgi:type II secretory pathway predicted ATPase ExeA